jgi:transcriptional regulator with XRE-family HTH domain
MDAIPAGERVRRLRKLRGLTQQDLARLSRLSLRTVKTVEAGEGNPRLETLHAIARALHVSTSDLTAPGRPEPDPVQPDRWDGVRDALYQRPPGSEPGEPATEEGVLAALTALLPAFRDSRYAQVRDVLPVLIRDALSLGGEGRAARSRVLNATAWVLTMTRQFDDAMTAGRLALDAAPDVSDSMAAVSVMAWCLLRQGRLGEAGSLAVDWADRAEPRFSRASDAELAGYGKVLLYVNNAMIRDNRPGEADDALSLARAAAAKIRRDVPANASTTMTFGPAQVQIISAENAVLAGQPDRVLALAERITGAGLARVEPAQRLRHRLDIASAHGMRRQYGDVVAVMTALRAEAPEWLAQQRYARDIIEGIIRRRRGPLSGELRDLAAAVRLPA